MDARGGDVISGGETNIVEVPEVAGDIRVGN